MTNTAASSPPRDLNNEALALALALGPHSQGPWPATELHQASFEAAWQQRETFPRWRSAQQPSEVLTSMTALLRRAQRCGGSWLFADDQRYPRALTDLPRPPSVLFYRGRAPNLQRAVAIVGSRAAYRSERSLAGELAEALAARDVAVISGGAIGIDTAAHEGALAAGGPTVAILGSGLDRPYPPRNVALFERIARQGWLLTPFAPDEEPLAWHFPARNGLIAALAQTVVVVAAAERSGALDTARKARALGRPLLAVPRTAGCRALIARGEAIAIEDATGLCAALDGQPAPRKVLDADLQQLVEALDPKRAIGVDEVAERLGASVPRAAMLLLRAELAGVVRVQVGGLYATLEGRNEGGEEDQ